MSLDSYAEIKSAPSMAQLNLAEFGGRCRKAMLGVCSQQCGTGLSGDTDSPLRPQGFSSVSLEERKRGSPWAVAVAHCLC